MNQNAPATPKELRELNPRFRKGQKFNNDLKEIIKTSQKRSGYFTPLIFLLVKHYAARFHLVDFINKKVRWDKTQWNVSPGTLAICLIYMMFIFDKGRIPLYKISESLLDLDLNLLFEESVQLTDFTSHAFATLLDRLHEAGCQDIFTSISLQVYELFGLPRSYILHSDTTSHVLYGIYAMCDKEAHKGLTAAQGHSKAHRPDLKQVKTGMIIDGNGIVFDAKSLDGNMSDSTWNTEAIQRLKELLGDQLSGYIYIADSKLVNLKNFKEMTSSATPLWFISLIPENFNKKSSSRFRDLAYREDAWNELGACCENTNGKNRATYAVQEFSEMIDGYPYRILIYRTNQSDKKTEKRLKTERDDLLTQATEKFKETYACDADALKDIRVFLKEKNRGRYQVLLESIAETNIKTPVGRPPKNPRPQESTTVFRVKVIDVVPVNERILKYRQEAESFALITNVSADKLVNREVLLRYKGQWKVENLFSRLKRPMLINTLFLKNTDRIEALMMLAYIAALFQAVMQAMARHRAQNFFELPKIRYAKRSMDNPTYGLLEWMFKPFVVISEDDSKKLTHSVNELGAYRKFLLYLVDCEDIEI
jgi:transposase